MYKLLVSLRVFGLLSSSLLLFPQRFSRYVLWLSSGVCRTRGTNTELRITSFIESTGVTCSDSVSHNREQVSIPIFLLACSKDWTSNHQMIVSFEAQGTNAYNRYTVGARGGNVYRRRKWTRRYEFKSWIRLIAFDIAPISLGKVWIQLFSLQLWVNSRAD